MRCRSNYFQNYFIPCAVREWDRLNTEIHNSTACQEFRKSLLYFIIPTCSSLFSIHHPIGVTLLVRLRFGFSHLCEHKAQFSWYSESFMFLQPQAWSNFTLPFVLPQLLFRSLAHMNDLNLIDSTIPTISQLNETALANILLYSDSKKSTPENSKIL